MKNTLTTILTIFLYSTIMAQAPQAINYQGVARDLAGNPVTDQAISLRIAILKNSANGVEVYKEIHTPTTSNIGLFTIKIGEGNSSTGSFANIDWGAANHFLQIELDETGGNNYQLLGTSQLLSVPYALYAESGGEWKKFNDGIFYEEGSAKIGIETGTIFNGTPTLNVLGGNSNHSFILRLEQGGEGVGKGVFWGSPGSTSSGRMFLQNNVLSIGRANSPSNYQMLNFNTNGNIGINESAPKSKLHIADGDVYIENVNRGVILTSPNGNCWRLTVDDNGTLTPVSIACPN